MGAGDRRDPPVEVVAHRQLLPCRLGVEVDDREGGGVFPDNPVDRLEGVVQRVKVDDAKEAHNQHRKAPPVQQEPPLPIGAAGEVGRAEEVRVIGEVVVDLPALEGVVAAGDDVDPAVEEVPGRDREDAVADGRILAVADDDVNLLLLLEGGELFPKEAASRRADDIADHKNPHASSPSSPFSGIESRRAASSASVKA